MEENAISGRIRPSKRRNQFKVYRWWSGGRWGEWCGCWSRLEVSGLLRFEMIYPGPDAPFLTKEQITIHWTTPGVTSRETYYWRSRTRRWLRELLEDARDSIAK